ncbi:MAG: M14 family zinc carboxypeptidase [Thermoplasmatota archaeon]
MKKKSITNKALVTASMVVLFLVFTSFTNAIDTNQILWLSTNTNEMQPSQPDEVSYHISLQSSEIDRVAYTLESQGYDVLWKTKTQNSIELIVNSYEYNLLEENFYNPIILETSRPFREIQEERLQGEDLSPPGYPDLDEIYSEMYNAEYSYPTICKVVDLTTEYNVAPTYENRHIYAVKISSNVNSDEDKPTALLVSCHHAREIVTPVIALYAIEQLTTNYGADPLITSLVNEYEIWISPVWNPDGYEYVFNVNNMWRKNRQYFPQYGSYGVDLNRNYDFGWYGSCSGSTSPTSETYKGPSPSSEAETQTMIPFSNDRYFAKVIDYHSYGREVLYGYHPSCHNHPFHPFFKDEAIAQSYAAGYNGNVRTASAEGEHYQWQIANNGTYANLMETHTTFQPSYASAYAEAVQIFPSILWLLQRPISVSGNVYDAYTGEALVVPITILDVNFENDEEFYSEPSFGRYHLFLPPGEYTLEFSAEGYITQQHSVQVTLDSAEILDIPLQIINDNPTIPIINGPTSGKAGSAYKYTFESTDPDNDFIFYYIDWGDGTVEDWIGPYVSGQQIIINHQWDEQGIYTIKAKAKDIYDAESEWGYLEIEMPVTKNAFVNPFILRNLQHYPFLTYLLKSIGLH